MMAGTRKRTLPDSSRALDTGRLNQKAVLPMVESFCTSWVTITASRQILRTATSQAKEEREKKCPLSPG